MNHSALAIQGRVQRARLFWGLAALALLMVAGGGAAASSLRRRTGSRAASAGSGCGGSSGDIGVTRPIIQARPIQSQGIHALANAAGWMNRMQRETGSAGMGSVRKP